MFAHKKWSTVDHLHVLGQLQEKCAEWQQPLWVAFIDFEKASDTIEHEAIWTALAKQGVPDGYVELLRRLYSKQQGQVKLDGGISRKFGVERGTKQGDPLSTLLFNAVLEDIFRELRPAWEQKRRGVEMSLGATNWITSLCFADDVALFAINAGQLEKMIGELGASAAKRGLKLHAGKTKILTNMWEIGSRRLPGNLEIGGERYEVLGPGGSTKYLGRKVSMELPHQTEFEHRVGRAWATFGKFKKELADKRYILKDRLRLLNSVVGATLLYSCETWTLHREQIARLTALQRKMLRLVIGARRRVQRYDSSENSDDTEAEGSDEQPEIESWPAFLRRTARFADELLETTGIEPWVTQWKRRKWRWAAKAMEAGSEKWTKIATLWQPVLHSSRPAGRRQARPRRRWDQDFVDFFANRGGTETNWKIMAQNPRDWENLVDEFSKLN